MNSENELLGHMLMESGFIRKENLARALARQFMEKALTQLERLVDERLFLGAIEGEDRYAIAFDLIGAQ